MFVPFPDFDCASFPIVKCRLASLMGAEKLEHILMVERLSYPNFAQEDLAQCHLGEHLDRDRVLAPVPQ